MKIGRGVSELWRVENRPLPLTWPMAYTTACTTVQAVIVALRCTVAYSKGAVERPTPHPRPICFSTCSVSGFFRIKRTSSIEIIDDRANDILSSREVRRLTEGVLYRRGDAGSDPGISVRGRPLFLFLYIPFPSPCHVFPPFPYFTLHKTGFLKGGTAYPFGGTGGFFRGYGAGPQKRC